MKNQGYFKKSILIDSHCHIDLYKDPSELCEETENLGIKTIAVTNLPSHFEIGYPHVIKYKNIRLALGFHPLYIQNPKMELDIFLKNFTKTSYIGEIGLDFTIKDEQLRNNQVEIFETVLANINEIPKYVTIHSRKAEKIVLNLLNKYQMQPCVFHWYTGPVNLIKDIIESGHFFSINLSMTTSKNGINIITNIPRNRVLTETDGPFTKVNGKPSRPIHVEKTIEFLSISWNLSKEEVRQQIYSNFMELLNPIKKEINNKFKN